MYRRLSLANLQANGDQANATVIAAPGAGKRLVAHSILATLSAAGTIALSEGDATTVNRLVDAYVGAVAAAGGVVHPLPGPWEMPANTALKLTTTGAANVRVVVYYETL